MTTPAPQTVLKRFEKKIVEVLKSHQELGDIRQQVPASWFWAKESIAAMARQQHVLNFSDFVLLCDKARKVAGGNLGDLQNEHEQRSLLRVLHDLGTLVTHGLTADDLTIRRDIALLDPNWLTTAIYKVLTEPKLFQQKGIFRRHQVKEWLDNEAYPVERHDFILDMMCDEEIGLCSKLPGERGQGFLVPEALPVNEPDYDRIWPERSLRFRCRYEELPNGLIPRFLVETHRRLTGKPTLWR